MPRTSGGVSLEVDGLLETIQSVKALEADLRKEANSELREAARACAGRLGAELARAAAASGVPVAPRVARSIKVRSDRIPVVAIGGGARVGTGKRAAAGALVWGSEQGPKSDPNRFAVGPNPAGYWIAPTVERFGGSQALATFRRAVFELLRRHDLA